MPQFVPLANGARASQTIQTGERVINQQTGKKHNTNFTLFSFCSFLTITLYLGRLHPLQQGITPTRTFQMKVLVKWSTFISCQDLATVAAASHKLSQSCDESNCECKNVIPSRISSVNISQMIIIIFTINKRLRATHCLVALTDWSV